MVYGWKEKNYIIKRNFLFVKFITDIISTLQLNIYLLLKVALYKRLRI